MDSSPFDQGISPKPGRVVRWIWLFVIGSTSCWMRGTTVATVASRKEEVDYYAFTQIRIVSTYSTDDSGLSPVQTWNIRTDNNGVRSVDNNQRNVMLLALCFARNF